jgi:two-component system sensor histidine kinase TctE
MREDARRAVAALGAAAALLGPGTAAAAPAPAGQSVQRTVAAPLRHVVLADQRSVAGPGWIGLALSGGCGLAVGLTVRPGRSRAGAAGRRVEAFARLAHDLRAPLTIIRGQCHSMRRVESGLRQPARLDLIDAEAARLSGALDGLVELARPRPREPGRGRREAVALAGLLAQVRDRHAGLAEARGVRLETLLPERPIVVPADSERLGRLLDNLVQNALRHCPAGGAVRLSLEAAGREAVIRVSDDGPGVSPGEREAIFAAGRRGGGAAGAGWGLGLAIAREIAEAHRGRLDLEPAGAGATFRLALPLGRASLRLALCPTRARRLLRPSAAA